MNGRNDKKKSGKKAMLSYRFSYDIVYVFFYLRVFP